MTFVAAALLGAAPGATATTFLGRLWSFAGLAILTGLALVVSVWPAHRSWRAVR